MVRKDYLEVNLVDLIRQTGAGSDSPIKVRTSGIALGVIESPHHYLEDNKIHVGFLRPENIENEFLGLCVLLPEYDKTRFALDNAFAEEIFEKRIGVPYTALSIFQTHSTYPQMLSMLRASSQKDIPIIVEGEIGHHMSLELHTLSLGNVFCSVYPHRAYGITHKKYSK